MTATYVALVTCNTRFPAHFRDSLTCPVRNCFKPEPISENVASFTSGVATVPLTCTVVRFDCNTERI